jgi:type IV pilus assembly protein PilM
LAALIDKINELKTHFETGHLIGIDIGLCSIKIILLSETKKNKYRIEKFKIIPLSEAAIIEDDVQKPDEIINAIYEAIKELKISKKITCLGMNGPNTVTKRLHVPGGGKEEVEDSIMWESEQYIPFGSDDAEIHFSIINENIDDDVIDVIVGAGRVDILEKYADYIKDSGLTAKIIDLNVFALNNVFELIMGERLEEISQEGAILVDFGAQYTTIIVYKRGGPILTKEIALGGVLLTEEIQRTMGVSYEEAEDLKIHGDDNGNLPEEILGLLESHNDKLFFELKKVINFYISAGSNEKVEHCFVTGGSARLPGIHDALKDLLDAEIEVLNPFDVFEIKGEHDEQELEELANCGLIALGLGMRKI